MECEQESISQKLVTEKAFHEANHATFELMALLAIICVLTIGGLAMLMLFL